MSITAILGTALTALQTNQAALRTTSSNITNVNTPGYQRREVNLAPTVVGGQLAGVEISEIRRIAEKFLTREAIDATSLAAKAEIQADFHDRIQSFLGRPDDDSSVAAQITKLSSAFGELATDPASVVRRNAVLASIRETAATVNNLYTNLQQLRDDSERQIETTIGRINTLIERIKDLNPDIAHEVLVGNSATGLMEQRDAAIQELAGLIDIRTQEQPDGRVFVTTADGYSLVSELYEQLIYQGPPATSSGTVFPEITSQTYNTRTGATIGSADPFDTHVTGGALSGYLEMRNSTIPKISAELGALAGGLADTLNAVHNESSAVPPPATLAGRNTGLLSSDSLGFTGETTVAVVSSTGSLVRRVDIDFDAGTLTVDGGGAVAFGGTVGGLVSALNTALTGVGSATFSNGVLTLNASAAGNGVAVQQSASDPSSRAGRGFSHFFGLNDLITAERSAIVETGLVASDAHGFTAGQTIDLTLRGPQGDIALQTTFSISGTSVNDVITALNTSFSGYGSFALDSQGVLGFTPASAYAGYQIEVGSDDTLRGGTGVSMSELFGLGFGSVADRALNFGVVDALADAPDKLALAHLDIDAATVPGDIVLGAGDNRGAIALQNVEGQLIQFPASGYLAGLTTSIGEYAATFLADTAQRASLASSRAEDFGTLKAEVFERKSSFEGVNLDEELANMMMYQQAYNAGARLVQVAQQLYDTLLSIAR